jgi:Na+/melibiose symporter-like transporter
VERLKKSLLYTYGVSDLFFTLMINMELYFFASFLTDYAQFPLILAGKILGVTSLVDIVFALVGGAVLQKVTLKYGGKYRSWFLIGPPLIAPLFILQFTKIGSEGTAALIVMFGFLVSHLLFNVVFAANGAMLGRLSQFPDERTILSTSRAQGMSAAGLIFSATAMPLILFFGAHTNKITGYTLTAGMYGFFMILGYLYVYRITAGKDPYDEIPAGVPTAKSKQSIKSILSLVFRNRPLIFLILSQIFANTSYIVVTSMAFYYFTYVADKPAFLSIFILAISAARLSGTFIAQWIGVKLGKRTTYWIFVSLATIGFASARFATDWLWAFMAVFCTSIMIMSVASSMSTALFADTVVYGEWKTGKSIRAFTMALMNFSIKVGILIRSAVVTGGLILIGFIANSDPSPRVMDGIRSMMTLVPAAGYAIAAVIFYFGYRLNDAHIVQMQEEIEARKVNSALA